MRIYIGKDSSKIVFTGLLLICLLSLPASAANVLDIQVTESVDLTKEFNGTTLTTESSTGTGTITITNEASEALYDISLNFDTGSTDSASWDSLDSNVDLDKHTGYVIVSINPLGASDSVTITYSCSGSEPVSFEESYDQSRILVGDSTNVTLTLNNTASSDITGIELVKTASDVDDDSTPDFSFSEVTATSGDVSPASDTITWNNFILTSGSTATLTFKASENDPDAHTNAESLSAVEHYIGNATLQFTVDDGSESGCGVTLNEDPVAVASSSNFEITLVKNQLDQSEGGNGGNDWGFTPTVSKSGSDGITYTISAVNLYATNTSNLETQINSTTYADPALTEGTWTGAEWKIYDFPYTVPVGWIDVDLSVDLSDSGSQITKIYSSTNGTYKLINKIYIINGYLVEAKKSIAKNATDNQYDITLWVHNKGNLITPPNVYVYDIIPTDFTLEYIDTTEDGSATVNSPITGTAYWWNVGQLNPDGQAGDEVTIHYTVEGSGTYRLTELFILGIDPSYTLNMQSTPVLKTGGLAASNSGAEAAMSVLMIASLLLGMVGLSKKRRDK